LLIQLFHIFPQFLQARRDSVPNGITKCFLRSFQFIIHS